MGNIILSKPTQKDEDEFRFSTEVHDNLLERIMDEFDSVQYYDDRYSISEEEFFYDSVHNIVLCDVLFKNKYNI